LPNYIHSTSDVEIRTPWKHLCKNASILSFVCVLPVFVPSFLVHTETRVLLNWLQSYLALII